MKKLKLKIKLKIRIYLRLPNEPMPKSSKARDLQQGHQSLLVIQSPNTTTKYIKAMNYGFLSTLVFEL